MTESIPFKNDLADMAWYFDHSSIMKPQNSLELVERERSDIDIPSYQDEYGTPTEDSGAEAFVTEDERGTRAFQQALKSTQRRFHPAAWDEITPLPYLDEARTSRDLANDLTEDPQITVVKPAPRNLKEDENRKSETLRERAIKQRWANATKEAHVRHKDIYNDRSIPELLSVEYN